MTKQRHIIGRTVLELDTGRIADVWSLQEDMSRLFQQQGLPEMERLFDQLLGDEEVVRLDQVVVDIGSIDRRFLADEFIHNLLKALRETLADHLADRLVGSAKTEKITRDRSGSHWEVLLYFLRYGRLPWWCPSGDWQAWFPRWVAVMQSDTSCQESLRELLRTNQAARQRLIEQLPESCLHELILQLQPAWKVWSTRLAQARQVMQSWELDSSAVRYLDRQAWLLLLGEISADNSPTRPFPATWTGNWLAQLVKIWRQAGAEADSQPQPLDLNQIRQRLRAILKASPSDEQTWLIGLEQVLTSISDITARSLNPQPAAEFSPNPTTDWQALLYFLQSGRLPPGQALEDWQDWLQRWETVMQTETTWQQPLRQLLRSNVAARQRLITQFPESWRHQLILQLQPAWTNWHTLLAQAKQLMQSLSLSHGSFGELETQAWELLLAEISADHPSVSPLPAATWTRHWLTQLVQNWRWPASEPSDSQTDSGLQEQPPDDNLNQIAQERLRTSIEAISRHQRSLWLSAYNQVRNLASEQEKKRSLQLPQEPPQPQWQLLLYFLQSGRLPNEPASATLPDWLQRWETVMQTETAWQQPLRQLLRTNVAARQRLITQFPESWRHQLILQLQPAWTNWHTLLAQAKQLMQSLSLSHGSFGELETQAWELLLAEIIADHPSVSPLPAATWTSHWLTQLVQNWRWPVASEQQEQPPDDNLNQIAQERLRTSIEAISRHQRSLWLNALEQVLNPTPTYASTPPDEIKTSTVPPISRELEPTKLPTIPPQGARGSTLSTSEETVGLYVNQAGIVLLHPFLNIYLDAVGLLDGEAFRDELAQQTAIYLLHYLATKQTDAPEYELVLPKLLCGWPLNEPVSRGLDLPATALTEGEHLLETVINYWEALKSTSPDGLREGFLQRTGKLTRSDDGNWKLQVEQQAIDILLGRLPWGLSMVKLPMMDDILIVEWH